MEEKLQSLTKVCKSYIWPLFFFAIAIFDPFGLASSSDSYSESLVDQVTAPFYESRAEDDITVVLIDDAFISNLRRNISDTLHDPFAFWPLSYNIQSELFQRILSLRPNTLFIDLIYSQQREPDENLKQLAYTLSQERYLKQIGQDAEVLVAISGDGRLLEPIAKIAIPALVSWGVDDRSYPLEVIGSSGKTQRTAAALLYQRYCSELSFARCEYELPVLDENSSEKTLSDVVLQWQDKNVNVLKYDQENKRFNLQKSQCADNSTAIQVLSNLSFLLGTNWFEKKNKLCPPYNTVYASALIMDDYVSNKALRDMIAGKIVLVGTANAGANDYVHINGKGLQPGVFTHAMALDNLITHQQSYRTDLPSPVSVLLSAGILFWLIICHAVFYFENVENISGQRRKGLFYCHLKLFYFFCSFLPVIAVCIYLSVIKSYALVNWVGFLLLALSLVPARSLADDLGNGLPKFYFFDHVGEILVRRNVARFMTLTFMFIIIAWSTFYVLGS